MLNSLTSSSQLSKILNHLKPMITSIILILDHTLTNNRLSLLLALTLIICVDFADNCIIVIEVCPFFDFGLGVSSHPANCRLLFLV